MIYTTIDRTTATFKGRIGTGVFTAEELDELIEAAKVARAKLAGEDFYSFSHVEPRTCQLPAE